MRAEDRDYGPEYPPGWDREPVVHVAESQHPCSSCGVMHWFAGVTPDPSWICMRCRLCPTCGGSGSARTRFGDDDEIDICGDCAGSGRTT